MAATLKRAVPSCFVVSIRKWLIKNNIFNNLFLFQFAKKHEQSRRQLELQQRELEEKRQRFEKEREVFQQNHNSVVDGHSAPNPSAK